MYVGGRLADSLHLPHLSHHTNMVQQPTFNLIHQCTAYNKVQYARGMSTLKVMKGPQELDLPTDSVHTTAQILYSIYIKLLLIKIGFDCVSFIGF